jgi:glycosyltransferase involved in cell wall biosynthesis
MKVLFVVPYAPTPIRTRPHNLMRALAARGHQVSLATLYSDEAELEAIHRMATVLDTVLVERLHLIRSVWNCLWAAAGGSPMQASYSWNPVLARKVIGMLAGDRFDVVHVEHLRGARFGLVIKTALRRNDVRGPAVVWDSVDCISALFRQTARCSSAIRTRLAARAELRRTMSHEGWLATCFDRVLVTSETDRQDLLLLVEQWLRQNGASAGDLPADRVRVIPNGVDLDYFSPTGEKRAPHSIVISGKMSYHANVTAVIRFVEEVMPKVWEQLPDAQLWVVGKNPPREVRRLGTAWKDGEALPPAGRRRCRGRVLITGEVEDLRPYLRRAAVAAAPIRYGAGIQNKVLEAMACGAPVVATPPAVSALALSPGNDLLVAENADELPRMVLAVLRNPELSCRLSLAGRRAVEQRYGWGSAASALERVYQEARG